MVTKFKIESGIPLNRSKLKRGPRTMRDLVKQVADAIREMKYFNIPDAASDYFPRYLAIRPSNAVDKEDGQKSKLKYFKKCIEEDLRNGPQSCHVINVLEKRFKHQRNQSKKSVR